MDFLGIKNAIDAEAIIGHDGIADGFKVTYLADHHMKNGKTSKIERVKTVWVREFDPNSVPNDGLIHGFGNKTVYSRSNAKPKKSSAVNLSSIQKILKK